MLIGDRVKYAGLLFEIAFTSFLVTFAGSYFAGFMTQGFALIAWGCSRHGAARARRWCSTAPRFKQLPLRSASSSSLSNFRLRRALYPFARPHAERHRRLGVIVFKQACAPGCEGIISEAVLAIAAEFAFRPDLVGPKFQVSMRAADRPEPIETGLLLVIE